MSLAKSRILLIATEAKARFKNALDSGRTVDVQSPAVLATLAKRGADLIVVDLSMGDQLLDYVEQLANFGEVPLLGLGEEDENWDRLAGNAHIEGLVGSTASDEALRRAAETHVEKGRFLRGGTGLIGSSVVMRQLRERILMIAATPLSTVLLTGESGAGKDKVAEALHHYSTRHDKPFKPINCAAIPENLLENELFGHEKGAYTDAKDRHQGIFEQAQSGTVFLDEIGEMPLSAQVRLLRVLEERKVTRIGGNSALAVEVRVVAATNRDLQEAVGRREFRLDLYHRLKVVELAIPPLRRRSEDIPELVDYFVDQLTQGGKSRFEGFSATSMTLLEDYAWPGNVRELRNLVEHLVFLAPRRLVEPADLLPHLESPPDLQRHLPVPTNKSPDQSERELIYFALLDLKREVSELRSRLEQHMSIGQPQRHSETPPQAIYSLSEQPVVPVEGEDPRSIDSQAIEPLRSLQEMEKEAILDALQRVGNNRRKAADILGISARTLYRKLKEYGIE
ncbi:MAG: sigma-54 interaction domain-containing protein [Candidatus Latescibacterota bacterium]|jgi:DNA-binding NtrC family response regulator